MVIIINSKVSKEKSELKNRELMVAAHLGGVCVSVL